MLLFSVEINWLLSTTADNLVIGMWVKVGCSTKPNYDVKFPAYGING